jgi:DNA-binding NarL/FixJ family response regulator
MPGMNGLIGLRQMITTAQASPVALISGTAPRALAEKAIMEGAAGFIPKTLSCRSMLSAARFMAAGEIYAPFNFMREPQDGSTEALSKRERDVLHGICRGQSNKEISHECKIHETTVKLHAKTLCRKLGARNRTHAAVIARDFNII